MNIGIYSLTNRKNGKRYIGQSRNLQKRKTTHEWLLRNHRHFNIHLQRAWDSGDRFDFEILEECTKEELNEKEIEWIKKLDTMRCGYNLCEGGEATDGYHFTEEQKEKISKANKGRKTTEETIQKRKNTYEEHMKNEEFSKKLKSLRRRQAIERSFGGHNKGTHHTEEEKRNLSEKLKGRSVSEAHRKRLKELYSGEGSASAKLKKCDVVEIRYRFLCGEKQRDIVKDYPNITPQTIYDIVRNRRWKSVPNTLKELEEIRWKQETSEQDR